MSLHKEISFETEICQHLASNGWLYAEGDAAGYVRAQALFAADVLAWVQATQPQAWETLVKNHGDKAGETLLARLRDQLDQRGTLDVLRHGVELLGLKKPLKLAEFKPALAINPEILARYAANRLRVVRQVKYSQHNENSIDLVLFLNGIPVATVELKTDFTQSIGDAIDQYRFDRNSKPKGQAAEPLLSFPNGALVHFAVSNSEVSMVTKLDGPATVFLPFNQGNDGAAGNPVNPSGHRTAYLWEQVWARESWLEILGRYLIAQRDKKKQITKVIFPRFHQLDVTRKLQVAVLKDGPGGKYLVQHSAGSGKTNSIAWTAHFLAELHDVTAKKVFDTVLVVSDRTVIDSQLQEALFDFQRTSGVVATIKGSEGSKSGELAEALSGDKKIVVCTIQTFPFALEAVRKLAATQGKRFAVIADEAHSSQTGEAASKLKAVLSPQELVELNDGGEVSMDDQADLDRYLDATRSSLLYARKVLLVEGPAEQFLIPRLVRQVMGVNLDELGIAVIPIYGTHFGVYAKLFGPNGIQKKCAVLADGDLVPSDADPNIPVAEGEDQDALIAPAVHELNVAQNAFVRTFQCQTTFERELTTFGTLQMFENAAAEIGAPNIAHPYNHTHK